GFATLAVPLALSAGATACVFALEGAALTRLCLRQGRLLLQLSGAALQVLAAFAFLVGLASATDSMVAIANPRFIGALLIALAGLASAWAYRAAARTRPALAYYLWGLAWWCGAWVGEVGRFVDIDARADVLLVCAALTG